MIGKIMDQRGWTREQVLWGESWINLTMQSVDQMKYVTGDRIETIDNINDLREKLDR